MNIRSSRNKAVRVPKSAEIIAGALRRRIVRGELKEGENLPAESVLIEEFGVSRPTMREAFRILETEQLVSISRGLRGGAQVHLPQIEVVSRYAGLYLQSTQATLGEIARTRAHIEPYAVSLFAKRRDEDDIAECNRLLDELEAALDDPEEVGHLLADFHRALIKGSGEAMLMLIGHMTYQIWEAHLINVMAMKYSRKLAEESLKSNRKLMTYIARGQAKAAEKHEMKSLEEATRITFRAVSEDTPVELIH